jgi:hypothetical protein
MIEVEYPRPANIELVREPQAPLTKGRRRGKEYRPGGVDQRLDEPLGRRGS